MLVRPGLLLRIEEACMLVAAIAVYAHLHFSWPLFGLLFLAPDLCMRVGAATYNCGHFLIVPIALFAFAWSSRQPLGMALAIIWFSHIVFDRMLGYGLKYSGAFKDTHLQRIS